MPLTKDHIPDTQPWRLSLLIGPATVQVFAHNPSGEDGGVVVESLGYDPSASSDAAALEEAVYSNPLLLQPFRKTDIVISTSQAITAPADTDTDAVRAILGVDHDHTLLESPLDDRTKVMYTVHRGVANFLQRTYDRIVPQHSLSALTAYYTLRGRRSNSARMFVSLGHRCADVVVLNRAGIAAARHFDTGSPRETAYYLLAIFRQCGLDTATDEIVVAGSAEQRVALMPILSNFAANVMPAIFPAGCYSDSSLAIKAPYPLVVLPLCE